MSKLKVSCLGGTGEIGMNLYLYETDSSAVVIDYGIMFRDVDYYGIDYIVPDTEYLDSISEKLCAFVLTHGHEDHIGAASEFIEKYAVPIYSSAFTAALLSLKLASAKVKAEITVIDTESEYHAGDINLKFIQVEHSIPQTLGVILTADSFTCLHISDFKSISKNVALPDKVDVLLLDSTNACVKNHNGKTEKDVKAELYDIFSKVENNVFFTTFSSNIERLRSAIEVAKELGRKIIIEGASIERNVGVAAYHGLISLTGDELYNAKEASREKNQKYLYIAGGCQGETSSSMYHIAMGERKAIKIGKGDLFIFSSRVIPGSEGNINKLVNSILKHGADVIDASDRLVHISGHASAPELTDVIKRVAPEYFIPIHGEYRHLCVHKNLALNCGIHEEKILFIESGKQIIFNNNKYKNTNEIHYGRRYFDSRGNFYLSEDEMNTRIQIAKDGIVVVSLFGKIFQLDAYGFKLNDKQRKTLEFEINQLIEHPDREVEIKKIIKRVLRKQYNRRPLIDVKSVRTEA